MKETTNRQVFSLDSIIEDPSYLILKNDTFVLIGYKNLVCINLMLVDRMRLKELNDSTNSLYNKQLELNDVKDKLIENQNNSIKILQNISINDSEIIKGKDEQLQALNNKNNKQKWYIRVISAVAIGVLILK